MALNGWFQFKHALVQNDLIVYVLAFYVISIVFCVVCTTSSSRCVRCLFSFERLDSFIILCLEPYFDCFDVLICFLNFRPFQRFLRRCVFKSVWNIIHFVVCTFVALRYDIRKQDVAVQRKKRDSVDVTYGCLWTFKSNVLVTAFINCTFSNDNRHRRRYPA